MSANKYLPHVFVFPEDDANRQIANGFALCFATRQLCVLPEADGWMSVRERFSTDHIAGMQTFNKRLMILLIDFDGDEKRPHDMMVGIPEDLKNRVFVLGALSEPEALRQAGLGSFETIGKGLANDCIQGASEMWGHDLLRHNQPELNRLRATVCPILA
jgi:hypothetical protein